MTRPRRVPAIPKTSTRAALFLAAALLSSAGALAEGSPGGGYLGQTLVEALADLESRGLKIFFTSHLVRSDMRITAEPEAGEPRQVLEQLLAPHGLAVESGPGGRLVVVAGEAAPAGIHGVVRGRRSHRPLAGVRVLIPGTEHEAQTASDGSFALDDLTAGAWALEAHLPGFVVERLDAIEVPAGQTVELLIELEPAPMALDEIVVTPSFITLLREDPVRGLALDREEIFRLPHLGDDIFRALTLLPGVAGEEVSAQFNVRGGRTDEVLIMLDRVELFEPFHLKDYGSALSIVTPRALREVNLITGGFPAEYGDRMSGVLDMSTVDVRERRTHLGLGLLSAEIGSSGTFDGERGHWFSSVRRGQLDLALQFLGQKQQPRYWDAFGKLEYQLRPGQHLGLHALHSDDGLDFFNIDPDTVEDYHTGYGNSYLWLTHQAVLGSKLFVASALSRGVVDRDRRSREVERLSEDPDGGFSLIDLRTLVATGLKQDWNYQAGEHHYWKWGADLRRLDTDYDYLNSRRLDDPLADIRFEPRTGTTRFARRLSGEQHSVYLSDRLRPFEPLTLELGLRFDEHTVTRDANLSPRFNLVWATGRASSLRFAWGYFYQSQRPYELQVEDGVTELESAERTEQRVVGFEHHFESVGKSGLLVRVEAYQRRIRQPRARYENLLQPVEIFPEIEPDRILIAPESGEAYGLELFVRGSVGPRLDWWASYAYSSVDDRLPGGARVPRRIDQPHAVSFDVNVRAGKHWNLNLAWRYHTGWPTTPFSGRLEEDDEGELEPVAAFGPLHGARLPDYHRLDLRASREWRTRRGVLGCFVEIQNLYDRENVAGFDPDFDYAVAADGSVSVDAVPEIWGRFLPSFGITWDF